jgi:protein phosphatase 2C family protein 2/3
MVVRGKRFAVAVSDMQGWRISMEDAHSLHLSLPPNENAGGLAVSKEIPAQPEGSSLTNAEGEDGPAFFGVFDGHGG